MTVARIVGDCGYLNPVTVVCTGATPWQVGGGAVPAQVYVVKPHCTDQSIRQLASCATREEAGRTRADAAAHLYGPPGTVGGTDWPLDPDPAPDPGSITE